MNIENLSSRSSRKRVITKSDFVADYTYLPLLWITGSFVAPSIRTWKRTSRWQYRRGKAGSDSECDGWRPPVDSFTNLLAKQTAWTHPVIIADGVSSARSRPYPIFIMPSPVLPLVSLFLFISPSLFTSCTIPYNRPRIEPIFASPFRHIDFRALRVHVAPQLSMGVRCIGGRVCHLDTCLEWNFRAIRRANSYFWFRVCMEASSTIDCFAIRAHHHALLIVICVKIILRYPPDIYKIRNTFRIYIYNKKYYIHIYVYYIIF